MFALVHGGNAGGWQWRRIADLLTAAGRPTSVSIESGGRRDEPRLREYGLRRLRDWANAA